MRNRSGLWILLALGALLLALPASAGAVGWGPQFSVSGPPVEELGAYEPEVVIDDAGNATYAWGELLSGYRRVVKARVYGADGSVGPVRDITGGEAGDTNDVRLTIDGSGNARLTWIQEQQSCSPVCNSAYQIRTVALGADGLPSGAPLTIKTFALGEANIGGLRAAENGPGELAIAFTHYDYGSEESSIDVYRVAAGVATEVTPSGQDAETGGEKDLDINDDGTIFVVWMDYDEGFHTDFYGALIGTGMSGAVQPLEAVDGFNGGNPVALIDAEGNGTAVYRQQPEGGEGQVYASRLEADETAGEEQLISSETGGYAEFDERGAAIQADGSVLVTYEQENEVMVARLTPTGAVASTSAISSEGEEGSNPAIGLGPAGDGVVLYESGEYPEYEITQAAIDAEGVRSGPAEAIGEFLGEFGYFESLGVAVSASGNAAAAWQEEDEAIEAGQAHGALRDAIAPVITAWVPEKALAGEQTVVAASGVDANPISYEWSFGDGATATGAVVPHVFAGPGSYAVTVKATDSAGNSATREATVEVVAAAAGGGGGSGGSGNGGGGGEAIVRPETAILKAPPKKVRGRSAKVRFVASVGGSSFECSLDRAGWKPCRSPLTLKRLKPGAHTLEIRAITPAGVVQKDPATVKFRILKPKSRGSR